MKKVYVMDTNVLLHDPASILAFEDREVVIPMVVIDELDKKKKAPGELGFNAREAFRMMSCLRKKGSLRDGVHTEAGGIIRVSDKVDFSLFPDYIDRTKADNLILATACSERSDNRDIIVVSNDIGMQILADGIGIKSEPYKKDRLKEEDLAYTGRTKVNLLTNQSVWINGLLENYATIDRVVQMTDKKIGFTENQFVEFLHPNGMEERGMYREGIIYPLRYVKFSPYGVNPRNSGQAFMQEALMLPASEIPLVIIKGPAGTAKTFYTMAVGLQKTISEDEYRHIYYTRANVEFDKDIGALPGDEQRKMAPLVRPCIDNLEELISKRDEGLMTKDGIQVPNLLDEMVEYGYLRFESMSFMRGRNIKKGYLFVDEAQNISMRQAMGILTRPGNGTKVILAGDPDQIDNQFLDKYNNGLSYAAERMKGSPLCAQITLHHKECERSPLAMEASKRLI